MPDPLDIAHVRVYNVPMNDFESNPFKALIWILYLLMGACIVSLAGVLLIALDDWVTFSLLSA